MTLMSAAAFEGVGYQRRLFVHFYGGGRLPVFLFAPPAYDRNGQG